MTENKRFIECSHEVFPVLFKDTVDGKEFGSVYALDLLNELNNENTQLKFQLKECREHKLFSRRQIEQENNHIKQTIQEAYETERTALGKSAIKQIMEQIK